MQPSDRRKCLFWIALWSPSGTLTWTQSLFPRREFQGAWQQPIRRLSFTSCVASWRLQEVHGSDREELNFWLRCLWFLTEWSFGLG